MSTLVAIRYSWANDNYQVIQYKQPVQSLVIDTFNFLSEAINRYPNNIILTKRPADQIEALWSTTII